MSDIPHNFMSWSTWGPDKLTARVANGAVVGVGVNTVPVRDTASVVKLVRPT